MKTNTIYRTHESWGDEVYFFTAAKYNEFMDGMRSCLDGDIAEPDEFDINDETGFFEGPYHKNFGREVVNVTDWTDESDLTIEYIED